MKCGRIDTKKKRKKRRGGFSVARPQLCRSCSSLAPAFRLASQVRAPVFPSRATTTPCSTPVRFVATALRLAIEVRAPRKDSRGDCESCDGGAARCGVCAFVRRPSGLRSRCEYLQMLCLCEAIPSRATTAPRDATCGFSAFALDRVHMY